MPDPSPAHREAALGILAGLILAATAWLSSGGLGLLAHASGVPLAGTPPAASVAGKQPAAPAANQPALVTLVKGEPTLTPTATPPPNCGADADQIGRFGFDPYAVLQARRPDVLRYYGENGWNPATQCDAIFDDWTSRGAGSDTPTTPAAYVKAQGWTPATPEPTPAPPADCAAPALQVARLGFDPYQVLALHRADVLGLYATNGWNLATQCDAIFDDWLHHPDGGPATTAAQFVEDKGWARPPTPAVSPTATAPASSAPVAIPPTGTPTPTTSPSPALTASPAKVGGTSYTVQPGDTLSGIAQDQHVTLAALLQANGIRDPNQVQAGQVLRIPSATPTP